MIKNTEQKLNKIAQYHLVNAREDLKGMVSKAERDLRDAIQIKSFGENDIMKKIRRQYAKYISEINQVLLYKEELPEDKRTKLFYKRDMYFSFLKLFSAAELKIEEIDKWVDNEFEDELTER